MALVYSYIRMSCKQQELGDSLRRQLALGNTWIKKNKHTAADLTLHDIGVSAFRGRNKDVGKLGEFLNLIRTGDVKPGSILLVENFDRLSREGVAKAFTLFQSILAAEVQITVLQPHEMSYTSASLDNIVNLMLPLMYFHLAYTESKNKSDRMRASHYARRIASEKDPRNLLDSHHPAWLDWNPSTKTFKPNKGVKAIQFIFEQSAAGIGQKVLTGLLQQKFEPLGRSGKWNPSYVSAILNDRSVLGERQPHWFDEEQRRVPVGEPIQGYYPPIVDEALFYRSKAAKEKRIKQKGPNSNYVNMLTGLVFNANDSESMHVVSTIEKNSKNVYRRLCSYGHIRKLPGSDPVSVPLPLLEQALILNLSDHKFEELNPSDSQLKLEGLLQKQKEFQGRATQLSELLSDPGGDDVKTIALALAKIRHQLEQIKEEETRLRLILSDDEPVAKFKTYAGLWLDILEGDDLELRRKIRQSLPDVLASVYVKPERTVKGVWALVQLNFHDGSYSHFWIGPGSKTGGVKAGSDRDVDLRIRENCQVSFFEDPADVKRTIPKTIPDTLSGAVDCWLRTIEPRMKDASWRVIAPKVKHFTEFVGSDFQVSDLDSKLWSLWIRHLKVLISEGKLAKNTAAVTYSRVREFVRFLVENSKVESFEGLEAPASKAL